MVSKDEVIMELYYDEVPQSKLKDAIEIAQNSFKIDENEVKKPNLIY